MDIASILDDVQIAIKLANTAIQIGQDAAPFIKNAYGILFEGKTLTDDERQAMLDQEIAWRSEIDAVIAKDGE